MVKYSLEAVNALLDPIPQIAGRPNFSSLWNLAQSMYKALKKLDHPDYPTDGWSGCLMTREEFALRNATPWTAPDVVGKYFVMPSTAITTTDQEQAKGEYKYKRDLLDSYEVILMALKATFERVIDEAYHTTVNTGLMGDGFGQLTPHEILQKIRQSYGRATIQEVEEQYLKLSLPMDRNLPIEVMIRDIEDVQRFMLATPADRMEQSDVQLCTHGLIKLSKTGGLYAKAVERWGQKDLHIRQSWREFKKHFIEEYEKMLAAGGGTTLGNEGYGGAYNAVEQDDATSLAESIVQYAERTSAAEGKVSDLESRLAALEMSGPPQTAYYMPHQAYNMQSPQQPPTSVHVPPTSWQPTQYQQNGKRGQDDYNRGGQRRRTNNYRGSNGGRGTNGRRNAGNTNQKYSNTTKQHLNLLYCYSCGYDVDHDGYHCPPNCQKLHHLPHIKRDEAHMVKGACMKAQHKTLPDGSGAGLGWIMTQNMEKGRFVLDRQAAWKQQQQQAGQQTWQPNTQQNWQQQRQQWQPMQQANNAWQGQPPQQGPPQQYQNQGQQMQQQAPQGYQQWGPPGYM